MSSGQLQLTLQRIQEIQSRFESLKTRSVDAAATPGIDFGAFLEQAQAGQGATPDVGGLMGMIQDEATQQGMDPALIKAIVKNESGFNPNAVSHAGAQGLMQLMPGTAKSLGVENSFDPEQNLEGGTKYLKGLIQKFQSVPLGVAAYNAGPGAVQKYGGVPPYAETTNYVKKVIGSYEAYKHNVSPGTGTAEGLKIMLRGLYTAAAGMLATTISTDITANNVANVNTIGYKRTGVNFQAFPEMLIQRMSDQGAEQVGALSTGSKMREAIINFNQGVMRETGNTFDLAIEGDGFFTVKDSNDINAKSFYTRAGNLTVNEEGYLTTSEGAYVQGELGNIVMSMDQGPFKINTQGEISARDRVIDRIKISRFMDNNVLQKVGDNLYEALPEAQTLATPALDAPTGYKIHQGRLEQANTNVVTELVNNIQGLRLYEALQKSIHFHNETLGKAVNEVGRSR